MKQYLLYDGVCRLCNGTVRFVLQHEQTNTLLFSPLHSMFSRSILKRHPELQTVDSVVFVTIDESRKESVSIRSEAVLNIIEYVGGTWKAFLFFSIVPKPIRDFFYDLVARYRHNIFGRYDTCPVPATDIQSRFIE